jgi:hypothetical protein
MKKAIGRKIAVGGLSAISQICPKDFYTHSIPRPLNSTSENLFPEESLMEKKTISRPRPHYFKRGEGELEN